MPRERWQGELILSATVTSTACPPVDRERTAGRESQAITGALQSLNRYGCSRDVANVESMVESGRFVLRPQFEFGRVDDERLLFGIRPARTGARNPNDENRQENQDR